MGDDIMEKVLAFDEQGLYVEIPKPTEIPKIYTGTADPTTTSPTGAKVGDLYIKIESEA